MANLCAEHLSRDFSNYCAGRHHSSQLFRSGLCLGKYDLKSCESLSRELGRTSGHTGHKVGQYLHNSMSAIYWTG